VGLWANLRSGFETSWTPRGYRFVVAALGVYLALHFALLLPPAAELFSNAGVLPDGELSPLLTAFPNVLALNDSPAAVALLVLLGIAGAGTLIIGRHDRLGALLAWYVLACLFGRNPLIANPSLPFVGLALLTHSCLPRPASLDDDRWRFPPSIHAALWIVVGAAYTFSGVLKLGSASWLDGTALIHVLENPLAHSTALRTTLLALPEPVLQVGSWAVLALECCALPLALFKPTRRAMWFAFLGLHGSLIVLIDFADLSAAMIVTQLMLLDPAWLRFRRRAAAAPRADVRRSETRAGTPKTAGRP